jgi:hypothetical protein
MMSKRKRLVTILIPAIAFAACMSILLLEAQTKLFRKFLDDVIYDNRNHYLSCEQLPTLSQVESVVAEHQDVIRRIGQVNPGFVGIEIDSTVCSGKADILFWYGSHRDRLTIEGIIGSDTFFGIPYRLQNR